MRLQRREVIAGYRACTSEEHEDDYEAMECAQGNPRYRCARERWGRREMVGWLVGVPLAGIVLGLLIIFAILAEWW